MHKLTLGLVASLVASCASAAQLQPHGTFTVSEHGPLATVLEVSGLDSANARVAARVSLDDLKQDCLDQDREGSRECSLKSLTREAADQPIVHASANCPASKLTTDTMDSTFAWRDGFWTNLAPHPGDDVVLDGSNASGSPLLDIQFEFLCPHGPAHPLPPIR